MWQDLFKKDIKILENPLLWKNMWRALAFVLLPNLLLWCACYFMNLARPIVNLDYLLVSALMVTPWRSAKIFGGVLFAVCVFVDCAMLLMQLFPFLDLAATVYLIPFLPQAPLRFIVLVALVVAYVAAMPWLLARIGRYVPRKSVWFYCILLGLCGWSIRSATYRTVPAEYFARDNYFISHSQTALYAEHYGNGFLTAMRQLPELIPIDKTQDYASKQLVRPIGDKVLMIVAESWGVAREASVQRAILQKIYDRQDKLAFIKEGYFDFAGATVQGELRELCQLNTTGGYAFHKTDPAQFARCLPNILKQQGYQTIAMHGASSRLYDRHSWYPKAGFGKTLFAEDLPDKPRCYAFHGACDRALYDEVAKAFRQNAQGKTFFYWLTLTSHSPYAQSDMHQPRLDCKQHQLFEGDICNNMRLNAQFFDGLAELIDRPEMSGTEVIVVGDHMPPIFSNAPIHKNLRWNDVSWLHFKIQ